MAGPAGDRRALALISSADPAEPGFRRPRRCSAFPRAGSLRSARRRPGAGRRDRLRLAPAAVGGTPQGPPSSRSGGFRRRADLLGRPAAAPAPAVLASARLGGRDRAPAVASPGALSGTGPAAAALAPAGSRRPAGTAVRDRASPGRAGRPLRRPLLLTGGHRSINKVVGLAFEEGGGRPTQAVKLARVPEAEPGLEREAEVLGRLGEERPELDGVPRLLGRVRRCGRMGVAESPIEGESMLAALTPATFPELARRVTRLLIDLAGEERPSPESAWRQRLVEEPLGRFEQDFGPALEPGVAARARAPPRGLGDLPNVCEHRDCSPWNIVLTDGGRPALLDWESAEPRGLPGPDLVYFLANSAFVLDGALEAGKTRESYAALLDPATPSRRGGAECVDAYAEALGLGRRGPPSHAPSLLDRAQPFRLPPSRA